MGKMMESAELMKLEEAEGQIRRRIIDVLSKM